MLFAGLPLATLLAIGGAAGALVVLFYVLKLRRRPIAVPFARIWERVLRDKEASSLFAQLKRVLSLLLQLVLLTLMLVALGDPRLRANLLEGRSIVVLVDASASMKAIDVAPSRIEVAKTRVREMVRGLSGSDRMLIARMDAAVTPVSTMTDDLTTLEAGLDQIRASDTRADLERAMSFALDSLRGLPNPEIILVSDGALGELEPTARRVDLGPTRLSFVPVGSGKRNVALTEFSVRRYPLDKARSEVMLEIANTNDTPSEVELSLYGDGQLIDVTRLKLGPNERLPRFYSDLSGASRTLEARLALPDGGRDELPADDRAYALMPERRRARVLVVSSGNTYLDAALLLDEYLDVTTIDPARYPPAESYDVTIFDCASPPLARHTGAALYLDPRGESAPLKTGRRLEMFGFDTWDRKAPVLRWMALGDVQVAEGNALEPEQGDRVLARSGAAPILVAGRRAGHKFLALGFDPRRSDFVLRVAWPLFVLNAINDFVEEDAGYVSSFRTGEVWQVPAPSSLSTATLKDPLGKSHSVPVKEGRAVYFGDQAGFYELMLPTEPEPSVSAFAANLIDLEESRIEPKSELTFGGQKAEPPPSFTPGVRRELWVYLVLAAVMLSVLEWIAYHRRVTV